MPISSAHRSSIRLVNWMVPVWLCVAPRATACAGIAWLSHKRRLRAGIVVVVDERTVVEVVYGGGNVARKNDQRSKKWGPGCLRWRKRRASHRRGGRKRDGGHQLEKESEPGEIKVGQ